jgi:hypothetical protein
MRDKNQLPDLTFPDIEFGELETPWNLNVLLYKGGATAHADLVQQLIVSGALGGPQLDRLELVQKLYTEINLAFNSGGARASALGHVIVLRHFFGFVDRTRLPLTLESVTDAYCAWADSLFLRTRLKQSRRAKKLHPDRKALSMTSAFAYGCSVGTLLNRVLERHSNILELTPLKCPKRRKTAIGVQAEKQNLSDTFAFGHLLEDICDGLTVRTIREASLPIQITLRSGKTITRYRQGGGQAVSKHAPAPVRLTLANLRTEAELLMFIGQTGMNLEQAANLELRNFFYISHLDGYQVKEHKARRGGVVLFEIFTDYKPHFERFLAWRRELFPHSNLLFPLIRYDGGRPDAHPAPHRIRAVCRALSIPFVSPRALRNTRVNWLLRMTGDPDLTAEMAQHTKQTLLAVYERPSLQRAMVEVTRFWSEFDPHLAGTLAVAPGTCAGSARQISDTPKEAPKPDCMRTSGCLWCESHRDVDSFDYVWALVTFKYLKTIELSRVRVPKVHEEAPPSKLVIARLHEKVMWFDQSNETRHGWVIEAQTRVAEGDFHPEFRDEIAELEGMA